MRDIIKVLCKKYSVFVIIWYLLVFMWKNNSLNLMNFKLRLEFFKLNCFVIRCIVEKDIFLIF